MRVDELTSFREYGDEARWFDKTPVMNGSFVQRFGDNIYTWDDGAKGWVQADSRHSQPGGGLNKRTLKNDTAITQKVIVSRTFTYWGGEGPIMPIEHEHLLHKGRGHHNVTDQDGIKRFVEWVAANAGHGVLGDPWDWRSVRALDARTARRLATRAQ